MREVWTLNLEGLSDGAPQLSGEVVSACAWSDEGLLAFASSASRPSTHAAQYCGYTSAPAIFIVHVDHPERHTQLSGGHESDIAHLSWVHRQMGTVLMSADERSCICLWKPVQGLINRWELHHRLQFGPIKLAQFLNQESMYNLPPPYFPDNEALMRVYDAAVTTTQAASAPQMTSYDAKYRKDMLVKPAPGAAASKPGEKKSLRTIPGCLCLVAVSKYGEARVFVELSSGPSGVEWSSAAVRLSSHQLPDSSTRNSSRSASASESSNQAVLAVESAALAVHNGNLLLAVAEESQIIFFAIKVTYWPLKISATPHTRTQLKSDIRLQGMSRPGLCPSLLHMCFNPTKADEFYIVYRMGTWVLPSDKDHGGQLKLERLRLKDKQQAQAQRDPKAAAAAGTDLGQQWVRDTNPLPIFADKKGARSDDVTVTHVNVSADGQFLLLALSSGQLQLRMLDTLLEAPPAVFSGLLGQSAAESETWSAIVASCSSPSANCMLLLDSRGRAKVAEMPHAWALSASCTGVGIANHVVHQLEVCLCKGSECWDVVLALGGILRSRGDAGAIFDGVIKRLKDNYRGLPEVQKRFYRQKIEVLLLRLFSMASEEHYEMQACSCEARLLLFYLLDSFRFALPFERSQGPEAAAGQGAGSSAGTGAAAAAAPTVAGAPTHHASAGVARLRVDCAEMMMTMGQCMVGLTVWNLHQAIKMYQADKRARAEAHGSMPLLRTSFHSPFYLDREALLYSKDLLKYYHVKLRGQEGTSAVNGLASIAGAAAGTGAEIVSRMPALGASNVAEPMVQSGGDAGGEVMAPPPVEESVDPPLGHDAAPGVDTGVGDGTPVPAGEGATNSGTCVGDVLNFGPQDVKALIDIVDAIVEANQGLSTGSSEDDRKAAEQTFMQKLVEKKVDPEIGLPHQLQQGCFARPEFRPDRLEKWLGFAGRPQGFLARACGYWGMDLQAPVAAPEGDAPATTRSAVPFAPLDLKRSFAEYSNEELLSSLQSHPEGAARREWDVLKRCRVRGPLVRECVNTGRVSSAQPGNALYDRWYWACPISGGRWRSPLADEAQVEDLQLTNAISFH